MSDHNSSTVHRGQNTKSYDFKQIKVRLTGVLMTECPVLSSWGVGLYISGWFWKKLKLSGEYSVIAKQHMFGTGWNKRPNLNIVAVGLRHSKIDENIHSKLIRHLIHWGKGVEAENGSQVHLVHKTRNEIGMKFTNSGKFCEIMKWCTDFMHKCKVMCTILIEMGSRGCSSPAKHLQIVPLFAKRLRVEWNQIKHMWKCQWMKWRNE